MLPHDFFGEDDLFGVFTQARLSAQRFAERLTCNGCGEQITTDEAIAGGGCADCRLEPDDWTHLRQEIADLHVTYWNVCPLEWDDEDGDF